MRVLFRFGRSHKKRKDSLEGGLGRVLFAAELSEDTSILATSEYIKYKHRKYLKSK